MLRVMTGKKTSAILLVLLGFPGCGKVNIDASRLGADENSAHNGAASPDSRDAKPQTEVPRISFGTPSVSQINLAAFPDSTATYVVTYDGADNVTLSANDISPVLSGTAKASVSSVTGDGNRLTVTLSSFSGDGTVGLSIAANTASNVHGRARAALTQATIRVSSSRWTDVTTIDGISPSSCKSSPVNCTMQDTVSGLKWSSTRLTNTMWPDAVDHCSDLIYNGVGGWYLPTKNALLDAVRAGIASASSPNWIYEGAMAFGFWSSTMTPGKDVWHVTLDGGLADKANLYSEMRKLVVCVRDPDSPVSRANVPGIVVARPPVGTINTQLQPDASVTFTLLYTDADRITLGPNDISVTSTGTAKATATSVTGSSKTRIVTLSNFTGHGLLRVSIAAKSASNSHGLAGETVLDQGIDVYSLSWLDVNGCCKSQLCGCVLQEPGGRFWWRGTKGATYQGAFDTCLNLSHLPVVSKWRLPVMSDLRGAYANQAKGSGLQGQVWVLRDYFSDRAYVFDFTVGDLYYEFENGLLNYGIKKSESKAFYCVSTR
jgi:hypothetical protein